jgi:hypothetical protein
VIRKALDASDGSKYLIAEEQRALFQHRMV